MVVNQTGNNNNVGGDEEDFVLEGDNVTINIDQIRIYHGCCYQQPGLYVG